MFENGTAKPSLTRHIDRLKKERWQLSPPWLSSIRERGRQRFEKWGLPHTRREEWKYTDVSALSGQAFSPPTPLDLPAQKALYRTTFDAGQELSPLRLVFINGFYTPYLSHGPHGESLPPGVEILSLREALKGGHPGVKAHLSAYAQDKESSFLALNDAYIEDGAFIYIPENTRLEHPVHLIYIDAGKETPTLLFPRNLIILEPKASVTIIEDYIGHDRGVYFTDAVSEILIGKNAEVDHYKLQRESKEAFHIAYIQVQQEAGSRFTSNSVTFGGKLTRNNIHSRLSGSGSSCVLNGLYMISGRQHVDNHTRVDHLTPGCSSEEVYHGILDDESHGVFNGKIYVHPGAQKTNSQQTSRSLLLSKNAVSDAKPQLEIFADDVKCSHGATVGRIDENALYYLRTRGVSAPEARKILTLAFARRVTDRFRLQALRPELEKLLTQKPAARRVGRV
ncbi:MAG: Fe-S cluster assembly protein SufD [Candidatus Aminicenantes bacterium]|nr:Fe-S cluster assembly protein SufD [Candidatus Aminicenantes bacterium]